MKLRLLCNCGVRGSLSPWEQDVGREVDIALRRQQRHTAQLESKVEGNEEALAQEAKRFKALDRALTEAQAGWVAVGRLH